MLAHPASGLRSLQLGYAGLRQEGVVSVLRGAARCVSPPVVGGNGGPGGPLRVLSLAWNPHIGDGGVAAALHAAKLVPAAAANQLPQLLCPRLETPQNGTAAALCEAAAVLRPLAALRNADRGGCNEVCACGGGESRAAHTYSHDADSRMTLQANLWLDTLDLSNTDLTPADVAALGAALGSGQLRARHLYMHVNPELGPAGLEAFARAFAAAGASQAAPASVLSAVIDASGNQATTNSLDVDMCQRSGVCKDGQLPAAAEEQQPWQGARCAPIDDAHYVRAYVRADHQQLTETYEAGEAPCLQDITLRASGLGERAGLADGGRAAGEEAMASLWGVLQAGQSRGTVHSCLQCSPPGARDDVTTVACSCQREPST